MAVARLMERILRDRFRNFDTARHLLARIRKLVCRCGKDVADSYVCLANEALQLTAVHSHARLRNSSASRQTRRRSNQ